MARITFELSAEHRNDVTEEQAIIAARTAAQELARVYDTPFTVEAVAVDSTEVPVGVDVVTQQADARTAKTVKGFRFRRTRRRDTDAAVGVEHSSES